MTRFPAASASDAPPSFDGAPLVSIILPVFNAEKWLPSCVGSLLRQNYQHIEIVAIDDGSTDASAAILADLAARDTRLRVISRPNRGLVATLNEALPLCRGDLIARMDSDDIAYPDRIGEQVRAFLADPQLALSGCRYDVIYGRDRVHRVDGLRCSTADDLAVMARYFTMLLHPTVMFRRSVIGEAELRYDDNYPHAEDFDLFRRIARQHRTMITDRPLLAYRVHVESVSATRKTEMRYTHLRIVAENLAEAHGYRWDERNAEILERVDHESVTRASRLIAALDRITELAEPSLKMAHKEGADNLFFFLYTIIWESGETGLLSMFVDTTGRRNQIRRRERYLFHSPASGGGAVGLKLLEAFDKISRYFRSTPARRAIPGFQRL
ncbi:glycosyltransferase family 2 protein [Sphingomonas sp. SRS2]|uniref:glycosyltransferase family 2 protein n=1 Tax=Sphingomonas sp. SRS2 TaxID=133190 RepID=UPI0006184372|nr:glycosyltransferase [Sphingomonas sp. SRS2]KKC27176.1 hypothetical protein WP12_04470 [Sphingomonas sp. SRS2]